MPGQIKPHEYESTVIKKKVDIDGRIYYKSRKHRVGRAFSGEYVALKETEKDGEYDVYFCNEIIRTLTL